MPSPVGQTRQRKGAEAIALSITVEPEGEFASFQGFSEIHLGIRLMSLAKLEIGQVI